MAKDQPAGWPHGAVTTPILIAGSVYAAGCLLSVTSVALWQVAVAAVAALVGALIVTLAMDVPDSTVAYTGFVTACGGGWLVLASATTPWSWTTVTALVVPALILAPLHPHMRRTEERRVEAARRQEAEREAEAATQEWEKILARCGFKDMRQVSKTMTKAGYTLLMLLPDTGRITVNQLAAATEKLEIAHGRLRRGAIRVEPGETAREVLIHVNERDVLAEVISLPDDHTVTTVNRPFSVGEHEDGALCMITLREIAALIVGFRGAGKSNLINVLIAQLTRCADTVIWMIDLKGGRTARPWLTPWLQGRTDRPVIDWVATTRQEAEWMIDCALMLVNLRSRGEGEKVEPDCNQPAVILICEEIAVLFGQHGGPKTSLEGTTNTALAGKGMQLTQLGRSEAVDPIFATQRATVTMIGSGDLKSQCDLRIGLGVATEADARLILPDDRVVVRDLAKLKHKGSGIVQVRRGRAVPVKFYRIEYRDISRIAETHTPCRPGLEQAAVRAFGVVYAQRWSAARAGHLLGVSAPATPPPSGGPGEPSGPAPASGDDQAWEEIVEHYGDEVPEPGAGGGPSAPEGGHPARVRMLEILRERGVQGATPRTLVDQLDLEGLKVARQTVHRWLAEEEQAGRVEKATYGRYKAR